MKLAEHYFIPPPKLFPLPYCLPRIEKSRFSKLTKYPLCALKYAN